MKKKKFKFNKAILSLIARELKSVIFSTTGLIVGLLFILVVGILVFGIGQFLKFGTNDLTQVFSYMVFAMAIAIPALVMGAVSKEKNNGTIEYLLSKPISEFELLFSKFVSYSILSTALILLTLPFTIVTASYAGVDFGQVFMQYLGAIVLAVAIVSVGIAVSTLFKTEVASFLTTAVIIALLIVAGSSFVSTLPSGVSTLLEKISLLSHFQSISRGVLDLRDLFYFVAFIFLFLSIAYYLLIKDKYPSNHKYLRNSRIVTVLLVIIAVLVGTLGQVIPGRLDFTSDQRYTLSPATTAVVNNIKDPLYIDYYVSSNLPIQFQNELRRVSDLLTDYSKASAGKINVSTKEPDKDESVKNQAESAGITPIQFSVNSQDSSQVVVGYFGIILKYQDKNEVLNFNTAILTDLEYQVTKKVKKLAETEKKQIAFVSNNVMHSTNSDLTQLYSELVDLFDVQQLDLSNDSALISSDIDAIIIPGANQPFDEQSVQALKNYYNNGGSIFLLTDAVDTNSETPTVNPNSLASLFEDAGIKVNNDIVYDLENNNIIALQSLFSPVIFNFPQWIVSKPIENNTNINKDVSAVSLLWASSIATTQKEGQTIYPLLETGSNSNVQKEGDFNTSFEQNWNAKSTDTKQTVGVAIENSKGGRGVIISDTDFITDNILEALAQRQEQNKEVISFTLNSISWLVRDSLIGSIKAKTNSARPLNLNNSQQLTFVAVSMGVPVLVCGLIFTIVTVNRRRIVNRNYSI